MSTTFGLIESIYAELGEAPLLGKHLDRLVTSASMFGIPADGHEIEARVLVALQDVRAPSKMRLELAPDGDLIIDTSPLTPLPERPVAIIAKIRLPSDDPILRHKTTRRKIYDLERARLAKIAGGFDVIFLNDRDEIAEGGITNVFAGYGDDLLTPPLDCGLLPGIMRAELLRRGDAQERIMTLDNLQAADRVMLTNAVRGVVEVEVDFNADE